MAHRLNNIFLLFIFYLFLGEGLNAQDQETPDATVYNDYKDKDQFKKFYKRRKLIAAWQINELKTGALVVRLKTNRKKIEALRNSGAGLKAEDKLMETFIIYKNTMKAYLNCFNFCKVYFIYSGASDSLLNGIRQGIFLDTNLRINPEIKMTENFYLLAERDYVYNSSIGFVPEDSARFVKEGGNPVREMGVAVKNKYGHQLKGPFPYYIKSRVFNAVTSNYLITRDVPLSESLMYTILLNDDDEKKFKKLHLEYGDWHKIKVDQEFTYPKLALVISQFNEELKGFYQSSPKPEVNKLDEETRKLLY